MRSQRGMALLVVLLILTVMVVVATNISTRFHMEMFRTSNLVRQQQAKWYAHGAEALVIKTLNQDLKDSPNRTHLGQYWATSGQSFPVDEGVIRGEIRDAQACFNVNGINSTSLPAGETGLPYSAGVFKQLLINLQVEESMAEQITDALRDWVDNDDQLVSGLGAEDAWYQSLKVPYLTGNGPMTDISELRLVRGVTPAIYRRLLPQICALPSPPTGAELKINVNTLRESQAPLLAALFLNQMGQDEAQNLLQERPKDGWPDTATFVSLPAVMGASSGLGDKLQKSVAVTSYYFEGRLQVEMDDLQVRFITLFKRQNSNKVTVIRRQYGGSE